MIFPDFPSFLPSLQSFTIKGNYKNFVTLNSWYNCKKIRFSCDHICDKSLNKPQKNNEEFCNNQLTSDTDTAQI